MSKKRVILTGATGMVGGEALKACLENDEIGSVISLARRASGVTHEKLQEVLVEDFTDLSTQKENFRDVDVALYCLAVYQGKLSQEDYRKITVDYTETFAKALMQRSPDAIFCLFSASGADSKEKSRMQFARDKGAAENKVFKVGFPRAHAFRPGYIYPVVKREEPNSTYRVVRRLYPMLRTLYPKGVVTSAYLAKAMLEIGIHGGEKKIYENKDIRRIQIS